MGPVVLVIEDEQGIADLIRDRLDQAGYEARVAYTGAEALRELKDKSPDIITMDVFLPDANGLRLLEDLKSDPDTKKIPVIVVSATEAAHGAEELGAAGFVQKPINFKKLLQIIQSAKARNELELTNSAR